MSPTTTSRDAGIWRIALPRRVRAADRSSRRSCASPRAHRILSGDRQLKHGILGDFRAGQFAGLASLAKNDDPIAQADDLRQLRADHDDRQTLARELRMIR